MSERQAIQYQILYNGVWISPLEAAPETRLGKVYLRYALKEEDGSVTIGLARPGTWRESQS